MHIKEQRIAYQVESSRSYVNGLNEKNKSKAFENVVFSQILIENVGVIDGNVNVYSRIWKGNRIEFTRANRTWKKIVEGFHDAEHVTNA